MDQAAMLFSNTMNSQMEITSEKFLLTKDQTLTLATQDISAHTFLKILTLISKRVVKLLAFAPVTQNSCPSPLTLNLRWVG